MGKILIVLGIAIVALGILLHYFPNAFGWFGKLPGDIRIERENSVFFFPVTTMILISIVVSFIAFLFKK